MKTLLNLLGMSTLVCVLGTACNGQKPEELAVGTRPVSISDIPEEVSTFFADYLVPSLFEFFEGYDEYDPVLTINSEDELKAVVSSSVELPEIDFDKYTLIIGQYYVSGGEYLKNHGIDTEPNVMKWNLVIGNTGKGVLEIFWRSYCHLYPKLPQKPIAMNTIIIKEY